jgi:hypothetical protein
MRELQPIEGDAYDFMRFFFFHYSGHSVLMGRRKNDWQDTDTVLVSFG